MFAARFFNARYFSARYWGGTTGAAATNSAPMRAYHARHEADAAKLAEWAEVERKKQLQLYRIHVAELRQQERDLERQRQEAISAEQARLAERVAKPSGKIAKSQRSAEDKAAKVVRYLTGELASATRALAAAQQEMARLESDQTARSRDIESKRIASLNLDEEIILILAASI